MTYDIVGWPTISADIRYPIRYHIRYVTLGCLVRRQLSSHEGLDIQYFSGQWAAVSRCPSEHASQRRVLLFRPPSSQVSDRPPSSQFQNMHPYRITSATDIPALVGTTYPALTGPPAVPETYLFSKELVAYLETPIAFSCNYRADDSRMAGKMDIRYRRLIYDIVGWYTIS